MAQTKEATTTKAAPAKGKATKKPGSANGEAARKATPAKAATSPQDTPTRTATTRRAAPAKAAARTKAAAAQAPTAAAVAQAGTTANAAPATKPAARKPAFSPEEALQRRAAEAESIIEFVDHTTLGGTEEDVTGELSTADQHPADTSDMTFQRELDLTVRNIAEQRRAEVEEALARQRAGTYGTCAECGKPIDPERLRARPEATLCIECARQREHAAHLA